MLIAYVARSSIWLRQLTRNKLLSGVIITFLAIGIGANTLVVSFINLYC